MNEPIRIPFGDPDDELFIVEDEEGDFHVAYQPPDPFTTEELAPTGVCVASRGSARDDLVELGVAISDAIRSLDDRARGSLSS